MEEHKKTRAFFERRDQLECDAELVLVCEARRVVEERHITNCYERHRVLEL